MTEFTDQEILELIDELGEEYILNAAKPVFARSQFTPEGFEYFFELVMKKKLTRQGKIWIDRIFADREEGKGTVIMAFRGSAKTTTLTIAFTAFFIGHHPDKSVLLVQVGDDIATDNSEAIADIISNNAGFRKIFPHVEPDKEKGWGAGGYEVRRNDMPYEEWRSMNSDRKDPTLLGLGYKSRAIIGKRPTGLLLVDDIHDENNTSSSREMSKVIKIVTGTIFPTMTMNPWRIFVGTPWTDKDCLAYVESTGEFNVCRTPVYDKDAKPMWPEIFGAEEIEKQKRLAGSLEFARMFLLDLEQAKGLYLKRDWLHPFESQRIDQAWPEIWGVDYASVQDAIRDKDRDYFTLARWKIIPGGGMVLFGGYRRQMFQGEAEEFVKHLWMATPTLRVIGVENIGKGEEFYSLLLRTTRMPVMPIQHGRRSKGSRFEKQMAPLFEFSRAWISDNHDEFLTEFVNEWIAYPNSEHDDCLDAAYMGMAAGQGNLIPPGETDGLPAVHRKVIHNPYASLGRA